MTIIWCMVPEIWSMTDIIFYHCEPFFALLPQPEKSRFWKNEKNPLIYYHFTQVYQKWQSWCMVSEIWSVMDIIFCHCGPFFALFTPTQKTKISKHKKSTWTYHHFTQVYWKWQSYDVWFLRYEAWSVTDRIFCHFESFFALLPP